MSDLSEVADHPASDSGLACLVTLARYHDVAVSAEQLSHEFASHGRPFSIAQILQAFQHLRLKAKHRRTDLNRLAHMRFLTSNSITLLLDVLFVAVFIVVHVAVQVDV